MNSQEHAGSQPRNMMYAGLGLPDQEQRKLEGKAATFTPEVQRDLNHLEAQGAEGSSSMMSLRMGYMQEAKQAHDALEAQRRNDNRNGA